MGYCGTCTVVVAKLQLDDCQVPNFSKHRQTTALAAHGAVIRQVRAGLDMSQEKRALLAEFDRS